MRIAVGLGLILCLAAVWGHYESQGASDPRDPLVVRTTTTLSVFGQWPYLVSDANGRRFVWDGVALGLVFSVVLIVSARTVLRRAGRTAASMTPR